MIIDVHVHLTMSGFVRGNFLRANAAVASYLYNRIHGSSITPDNYIASLKANIDPDGDKLLTIMDKAGVDKSVIFGVDWAYGRTGEPRISTKEQNRIHANFAKKHPNRFVALAALDPRRPDALELAQEFKEDWNMSGFKLHPCAGFYPEDNAFYPFYKMCADWKVPILFHSGGLEGNWTTAHPARIATVAEHFPDIKVIMGHAGMESWQIAAAAAAFLPNVYLDISVIGQWMYCRNPQKFYRWLRNLIDEVGPSKVLFASDRPLPASWISDVDWVKAVNEPKTDIAFSREELDLIMGKAAAAIFGLGST